MEKLISDLVKDLVVDTIFDTIRKEVPAQVNTIVNPMILENYPPIFKMEELELGIVSSMTGPIDIQKHGEFQIIIPVDGTVFDLKSGVARVSEPAPFDIASVAQSDADAFLWLSDYEVLTGLTAIGRNGGGNFFYSWEMNFKDLPDVQVDVDSNISVRGSPKIDLRVLLPFGLKANLKTDVSINLAEGNPQALSLKIDTLKL